MIKTEPDRLADELERLADEHLDANDKLNLSYYLNEYETNSCDLSELLATLMQNLLTKLPNPLIKYKLLSLIKQIYIEPSMHINPMGSTTSALDQTWAASVASQKHQLDLRLFEAMTQRYLLASNALICNNALPTSPSVAELQRKRRRQRRAAELKLFGALAAGNNRAERLRNLGAAAARSDGWRPQTDNSLACHSDSMANCEENGNEEGGIQIGDEISALVGRVSRPTNGHKIQQQPSKSSTNSSRSSSSIGDSLTRNRHIEASSCCSIALGSMEPDKRFGEATGSPASYRIYQDTHKRAHTAPQSHYHRSYLESPPIKNAHNEDEPYCSPGATFTRRVPPASGCCRSLEQSRPALVGVPSEFCCDTSGAGDLLATSGQVGAGAFRSGTASCELARDSWQQGVPIEDYHRAASGANSFMKPDARLDVPNYQPTSEAPALGQLEFPWPMVPDAKVETASCCCCYVNTAENPLCPSASRAPLFEVPAQGRGLVTSGLHESIGGLAPMQQSQGLAFTDSPATGPLLVGGQHHHQRRPRRRRTETASSGASPYHNQQPIQLRDYPVASRSQDNSGDESDQLDLSLFPSQVRARLPVSVAQQMNDQANNFVHQFEGPASRSSIPRRKPNLQVRRTLRVKIKKSKPILGIAIEGGVNVSGQLLPRIVCVHEDGAAYQCGKLRASDLILEVNGRSTVNMTHDEIAKTIANAYYQDPRSHIEFLIGESVHI